MRRHSAMLTTALCTTALMFIGLGPAHADFKNGQATCRTGWSWSGVNSNRSTSHKHETDGWWRKIERGAGVSSYEGWYQPGGVYMELDSAGAFASHSFGCKG